MPQSSRLVAAAGAVALFSAVLAACGGHANEPPLLSNHRRIAATSAQSTYANAILADGPVRFYELNEENGPSAIDSSGNGAAGTYDGPVQYGAAGPLLDESSSAVTFDAGAYDVGVRLPSALGSAGSYTIETWVRPAFSGTYMTIWGTSSSRRLLVDSRGYLLSQFAGNFQSKHALSNNAWHFVVFVYDASTQTASYYIDGALDNTQTMSSSQAAFTSPYYLGEYDTSANYKWHGSLGEHAVYASALTGSKVLAHYHAAGYPPASPTPAPTAPPGAPGDSPCSGYRWPIKVLTDANASSISTTSPVVTTIKWLTGIPKPNTNNDLPRFAPTESTVYYLSNVTLSEIFHAEDGDYHLVLKDSQGRTMIAESPDSSCAGGSELYSQISAARKEIAAQYPNVSSSPAPVNQTITIEGVPFFDYAPNYAPGQASNGIELHSITAICFGTNCKFHAAAPVPSASPSPTPSQSATPSPSPSSSYASSVLAQNPLAYLQLNESSGPTAYDSSANGNNGTYVGSITYGTSGPLKTSSSSAIAFSGGTSSSGVQLPNPNATSGTSYSIEVWVYPAAANGYMAIWGYSATHRLLLGGTGLLLSQFDGNFFSKNALTRNAWHDVVFVYDASAQTASYYIDGSLDSTSSVPAASAAFTSGYYLGQYDTGTYYKWNGRIAQAAFYRSALTAAQIAQHYSAAGY